MHRRRRGQKHWRPFCSSIPAEMRKFQTVAGTAVAAGAATSAVAAAAAVASNEAAAQELAAGGGGR